MIHFDGVQVQTSLLSNMDNEDKDLVVEAAKLSGFSDIVYINDVATYGEGRVLDGYFGLHTNRRGMDHHDFWEKFKELKAVKEKS